MLSILKLISYLLVILTFLPLVRDSYWIFRALEYPRFQKLVLVLTALCAWLLTFLITGEADAFALSALAVACVYLLVKVFPYSMLARKEVATCTKSRKEDTIGIFSANVYQDNTQHARLLSQIRETDPDVILLLETDERWKLATEGLKETYPYTFEAPQSNTYGLLFFSRLKPGEGGVRYLVKHEVPSIEMAVFLRSGVKLKLFGLHPEPPVPGESMRSDAKDKELMKVAFRAKDCQLPCIVFGDLNDVAWSYTTSLFTRVSGLLDVRCGRGFYSTFSAKSRFMRFPLDYIFCSRHFALQSMRRLPFNGSDHFPIYTCLVYQPESTGRNRPPEKPDAQALGDAEAMAGRPAA